MKAVYAKGSRWALACVFALVFAAVVAIPVLATADETPEIQQAGEATDKPADEADKVDVAEVIETAAVNDADVELETQQSGVPNLKGVELEINGISTFSQGQDALSYISELCYRTGDNPTPTIFSKNKHFEILGYEEAQGKAPDLTKDSYQTGSIGSTGSYYVIVEGKTAHDEGSEETTGFSGRAYAPFTVQSSSEGGGQGPGGNSDPKSLKNGRTLADSIYDGYVYTGEPIVPQFAVSIAGVSLVEGQDYKIVGYKKAGENGSPGASINGAPTEPGDYFATLAGIAPYKDEKNARFSIYVPNSFNNNKKLQVNTDLSSYAYTGKPITPNVVVILDGVTLTEGKDYTISYVRQSKGEWNQESDEAIELGRYKIKVKAVEGGSYTGEALGTKDFEIVDDPYNLEYATVSFANQESTKYGTYPPTVELENGKAVPPAVVVTSPAGVVLKEGVDYSLKYKMQGENGIEKAEIDAPGTYNVVVKPCDGSQYTQSNSKKSFYVAQEGHDISKATVTMPASYDYKNDAEIRGELNETVVVMLDGKKLTPEKDYYLSHRSANEHRPGTGTLGIHKLYVKGNMSNGVEVAEGAEKYWGVKPLSYEIWNEEAPAADKRVDTETGVKVEGSTISDNSTAQDEQWVSMGASKPADSELTDAAKKAKDEATTAGAQEVLTYDVTLEYSDQTGVSRNLTEGLDVSLSFPVDAKYNGYTATITQIHDGKALPAKTVTIQGGMATVPVDSLSEFVISVDKSTATDSSTDKAAATKATKSTTAKTGDMVLPMVIGGIVVIAIISVIVLLISRRRSQR